MPVLHVCPLLLLLFCQCIIDMVRPFSPSTTVCIGIVTDAVSANGINNVTVLLDGPGKSSMATDSGGLFFFNDITTGKHLVTFRHNNFKERSYQIDCTLDTLRDTFALEHLESAPVLKIDMVDTASMVFSDDTVTLIYTVTDSSGGITILALDFGNGTKSDRSFNEPLFKFSDTVRIKYDSSVQYMIKIACTDNNGVSTADSVIVTPPALRRPRFALIRPGEDGFISGEERYLSILVDDPDNVMNFMSLDWGDSSDSTKTTELYWAPLHAYSDAGSGIVYYDVTVRIFSNTSLVQDTVYELPVRLVEPIILDKNMFFKPGDYLDPAVTQIRIGVRVLQIVDSWVAKIIWIINENDPNATFFSSQKTYTDTTGVINPAEGLNLFTEVFETADMKRVNEVTIKVFDHFNNSATITGSFIIAGKGD